MKFIITRTSGKKEFSPCEEAVKEQLTQTEEFMALAHQDISHYSKDPWFKKGSNHRSGNDCFLRDLKVEKWVVNIENLEELIEFQKKYGEIIIWESENIKEIKQEIEIYDTCRE